MKNEDINTKLANMFDINTLNVVENVSKYLNILFLIGVNVFKGINNKNEGSIPNYEVTYWSLHGTWLGIVAAYFISRGLKKVHGKAMSNSYNKILKKFNELANELGVKEPINLFLLYTFMYSNGYLSYDKDFDFGSSPDIICNFGSSVINGKGVCRHIASLFTDILNFSENNGIKAGTIGVYAYDNQLDDNENELVNKSIDKNLLLKPIYKILGNHAITMCEYEGKLYAFDPTNETNLKIIDPKKLIFRGYGLDCKYLNNVINFLKRNNIEMIRILKKRNFYIYSEDDLKKVEDFGKLIEENKDKIEKFYEDNKDLYSIISRRYSRCRR